MSLFKDHGILGINARNLLYIRPYNKKKAVRMADNKLKSKQFLSARGVPVPKLFATIRDQEELERFDFSSLPSAFVLKPNYGFGGEGIIPIIGRKNGKYVKASGSLMTQEEIIEHIGDILDGRFSLSGVADTAFFEQLVVCDETLDKYSYKGLPDIRIVVHNLIPVMAMLRLPTIESDGKANIHQGAVGVGIDIARGTTTHILYRGKIVDEIPGIGPLESLQIPYWDEILEIASKVQLVTNLGYLAADIVIDKNAGPVLLEINARAGLAVQIANLAPLRKRLQRIEGVKVNSPEKGVRIAKDMFSTVFTSTQKKEPKKEVIGNMEKVRLLGEGHVKQVWASINPLLEHSIVDRALAEELELSAHEGDSGLVKLKVTLAEKRVQTLARLEDLSGKEFDVVLGRRDLRDFLIDPSRNKSLGTKLPQKQILETPKLAKQPNFSEVDQKLISIDRQLKLLYHLKPTNLVEQRERFMKDPTSNPEFIYPELMFDSLHLREDLAKTKILLGDDALSQLFMGKALEIEKKIHLLESIGTDNFTEASLALFGRPDEAELQSARNKLAKRPSNFPAPKDWVEPDEAVQHFREVLDSYGLSHWKVKIKETMVADCLAGKSNALFVRKNARFTKNRIRMLVAHEIETHVLTAENGKAQPYRLFSRGWANYLETQEGLAIWNQEHVLDHDVEKNYRSASLVFVVDFALTHTFVETFDYCRKLGMTPKKAFQTALKVKRGFENTAELGAFTKDHVYYSGYLQVKRFIAANGNLKDLYFGKYNLRDLEQIKQVPHLLEPKVIPNFLR